MAKIALASYSAFFLLCCAGDKPEEAPICRNNFYNEQTEFCYGNFVYEKCDGYMYNPKGEKCENGVILTKCGEDYYNERIEFCYDDEIYARCKWDRYTPGRQKCENDTILTRCGNEYYNEKINFCYNGVVYAKCGDAIYDLSKQQCAENGSDLLNHCNGLLYDPYSQYCVLGNLLDKEIFTDKRDGKEYKAVVIGGQTWMAENLNYSDNGNIGKCYLDYVYQDYYYILTNFCDEYGRLYSWDEAINACPEGWHLPSGEEWKELANAVGSMDGGKKLKSTSGWNCIGEGEYRGTPTNEAVIEWGDLLIISGSWGSCREPGNGSDEFGFSALPGGTVSLEGTFGYAKEYGFWWSSTNDSEKATYLRLDHYKHRGPWLTEANKVHSLSVRCIKY